LRVFRNPQTVNIPEGTLLAGRPSEFGTLGRNTWVGPGLFNIDTTLSKRFRVKERYAFEIRAEGFNLLNNANYNQVARIINAPGFGAVDSELPMRELQFGAKVIF
jgi:hypothetical protein